MLTAILTSNKKLDRRFINQVERALGNLPDSLYNLDYIIKVRHIADVREKTENLLSPLDTTSKGSITPLEEWLGENLYLAPSFDKETKLVIRPVLPYLDYGEHLEHHVALELESLLEKHGFRYLKRCANCTGLFIPIKHVDRAVFCSRSCRHLAYQEKIKQNKSEESNES